MVVPDSIEDLGDWMMAGVLTNEVCFFRRRERLSHDFGLTDQLRLATIPAVNSIAVGWAGINKAKKLQGRGCSLRSCGEVRSRTHVLLDKHFISQDEQSTILNQCIRTRNLSAH